MVTRPQNTAREDIAQLTAESATRDRLLNCFIRELRTGWSPPNVDFVRFDLSGTVVQIQLVWSSISGHHIWGTDLPILREPFAPRVATHDEFVRLFLDEIIRLLSNSTPNQAQPNTAIYSDLSKRLSQQISNSTQRTAHFVREITPLKATDAYEKTRHAEQSVRLGHPFHPIPKSAVGSQPDELAQYAPELGTSFQLHYVAVRPEAISEEHLDSGDRWIPADVQKQCPQGYAVLPMHPLQSYYLENSQAFLRLVASGVIVPLGLMGELVYPTSSVRTVCDPAFRTSWKLPIHLRLTNFVRNTPTEQALRAITASALVKRIRRDWAFSSFDVLVETGRKGLNPEIVGEELAAETNVLFRENPFAGSPLAPQVLAGLVERYSMSDIRPTLLSYVEVAGGGCEAWLEEYLEITLVPMLSIFGRYGLGFEAHLQNSLVHIENGWPTKFWVRDMEGAFVSKQRIPNGVCANSPLVYDEGEAWMRLRYHLVVNHLATVIAVLGYESDTERKLWSVVARTLQAMSRSGQAKEYADDLLSSQTLPAKANLSSWVTGRGEMPTYVDIPNPIWMNVPG